MFEQKTVIITGGASGIGEAMANCFSRRGAHVVIGDLNADDGARVADECGGAFGVCDVTRESDIAALIELAEKRFGPVDIFCSNAGFAVGQPDTAASASDAVWQANWDVHVMAHVRAARLLLPKMIARGSGYLVNVASAAGELNQVGDAAYSATKHAAVSFAESLNITHKDDGINASVVCPQYVATPLLDMDKDTPTSDSLISADTVANCVADGLERGTFLILPHPTVHEYAKMRAADREKWLGGMRALRRKFIAGSETGDLREMHRFI